MDCCRIVAGGVVANHCVTDAYLPDESGLAAHVWAGDDVEPAAAPLHHTVVGNKRHTLLHLHARVTRTLRWTDSAVVCEAGSQWLL